MDKLKPPPPLQLTGNLAENWRKFKQRFQLYMTAADKDGKSEKVKSSILLSTVGEESLEIYNTFHFDVDTDAMKLQPILQKYEEYFIPKRNLTFERHRFFTCSQKEGENIDQYVTELKNRAKHCEFDVLNDSLIKDRIVCGIFSDKLRERLLREEDLTLHKAVLMCRAEEASKLQVKELHPFETIHSIRKVQSSHSNAKTQSKTHSSRNASVRYPENSNECSNCGFKHYPKHCPAYGKSCNKCGKRNHFARVCRSSRRGETTKSKVHAVEESLDELFIDSIGSGNAPGKDWIVSLDVNNTPLSLKLDTGAQATILSQTDFNKLADQPVMLPSRTRLTGYSNVNIPVLGQCRATVSHKDIELELTFIVTPANVQSILGLQACDQLNLVRRVLSVDADLPVDKDLVFQRYAYVFDGLGSLPGVHHIEVDPDVPPVVHACRRVPFALHDRLQTELNRMEKMGVIAKVNEPTDWVSPLVIVEKPNKQLRVCLDPKDLNIAIKREHFKLPTRDEIISKFSHARCFSKLDASSGFWQLNLDKESSKLCTFITPFGRWKFLRLPFGISSAPEVYHKTVHNLFDKVDGVDTSMDDVIVSGSNPEEHDKRLVEVLDIARQNNLKLNPDKCVFRVTEVTFLGEVISSEGVKPDQRKVEAIQNMERPTCKKDIQRFLGMVNYLGKFVPHLSEKTQPLRQLLDKNVGFQWLPQQEHAWQTLKQVVSQEPVLKFFDPEKRIKISSDASQNGLGAVLLQQHDDDWMPVAYASKALTSAETRYAQIEKEMLSITFACEHFHQFIYGQSVLVETDHKPLVAIFNKSLNECPLRIQRFMLRMQKYDVKVLHIPGKFMFTADTLSRSCAASKPGAVSSTEECVQAYVDMVVKSLPVSTERYAEIRQETSKDPVLAALMETIESGWFENRNTCPLNVREYWNVRSDLTVVHGVIFKGVRVVIPSSMRNQMLDKIHAGHLGISKCRQRAREVMYWPRLNHDIDNVVSNCSACQTHRNAQQKEPLEPHQTASRPWQKVAVDLFYSAGKDYLVLVDYVSNYPEVCYLPDTTSRRVINTMKTVFARHGVPDEVFSDNGPQFRSREFQEFAKSWNFSHSTSSPYYAQSNGLAEKAVQIVKNIFRKEDQDPYMGLLAYRSTPLECGQSPAQILMGRRIRANLPVHEKLLQVPGSRKVVRFKQSQKTKQKQWYDRSSKPLKPLQSGDRVAVRDRQRRDWSQRGNVVKDAGHRSYVVKTENDVLLRRNRRDLLLTDSKPDQAMVPPLSTTASTQPSTSSSTSTSTASTTTLSPPVTVTRYGRVSKPPQRLNVSC